MASDLYIAISFSDIYSTESKDAWITGPSGPPSKEYFVSLESQIETETSIFARINEFVDSIGVVVSTDFYIPRPSMLTEDESTVLGVTNITSSFV